MKRFFSVLVCIMLVISTNIDAHAGGYIITNEPIVAEEYNNEVEVQLIGNGIGPGGILPPTDEEKAAAKEQIDKPVIFENEAMVASTSSWTNLLGYVNFAQETSYYCGPAAGQSALKYLTGIRYEQAEIYRACAGWNGVTLANLINYTNSVQTENNYIFKYDVDANTLKNNIYTGIVSYNAPSLIALEFSVDDGWLFDTDGLHCVSIYAVKNDKSEFMLADPWIGFSGSGLAGNPSSYAKSIDELFAAYTAGGFAY